MKRDVRIFMEDCAVVEDKIYFFAKEWNALYVVDFKMKKTKFVGSMPEEKIFAKRLCAGIVYYNKKLILVPMTAEKIWIFDLENNQWKGIKRKLMADGNNCHGEIFRAVEYKNDLFLIGSNYPAIIRMNMTTYELEYLTEPYTFLKSLKKDECYFRADFCVDNNQILLASCLNNYVLCVNLDSFHYEWYEVGEKGFCYSGIAGDGRYFWLSPRRKTPIVRWNKKNDEAIYFPLPDLFDETKYNFLGVQYHNGKLVFPGMLQDKTIIIDSYRPDKMDIFEGRYLFYRCFGKDSVALQRYDGLLQLKYLSRNEQYDIDMYCEIPLEELIEYLENHLKNDGQTIDEIQIETSVASMPLFLSFLEGKRKGTDQQHRIGEKIWQNGLN